MRNGELRFVTTRVAYEEDKAVEIVAAMESGTPRWIPLTAEQALGVIKDLAGYLRMLERQR